MSTPPTPIPKLVSEQVPNAHRGWVDAVLIGPLNRALAALTQALNRPYLPFQLLQHRGLPPSTTSPLDLSVTFPGKCVGVWPVRCRLLVSGAEGATVGNLPMPTWTYLPATDRVGPKVRLTDQQGLTAGVSYVVTWMAIAEG